MKTKGMNSKMVVALVTVWTILFSWSMASSAPFHNQTDCTACHDFDAFDCGSYFNIKAIKCTINTQSVDFRAIPADYFNGTDGVCDACHTKPGHHYLEDCTTCHGNHCTQFQEAGGAPSDPGHNTHITENPRGPDPLECAVCHGGGSYDLSEIVGSGACDTCHSPGGAFDGVNDATIGAAANWDSGVYDADGKTLQSGKGQWCAGCHDAGVAFSRAEIIPPVIVDNLDATYAPSESAWPHSTGKPPFYGSDVQYHAAPGDGSATCTWTPNITVAGNYKVYAMWTSYWNRASNTPYTINYDGGSETVWVNQQQNGGKWNLLGAYPFAAGTGSVVLSDNATGGTIIIADAVMFENADNAGAYAPDVVGDNATYGYYINGHNLSCAVCHDATIDHIDHIQRTYEVDEGTGNAINTYEDGYRLRNVAGARPMVIPKHEIDNPNDLDPAEFALCFMCHDSGPILSLSPANTNFKRDNDPYTRNFHQYHLGMESDIVDSDWDAVPNGPWGVSLDSMASCTTCHNVHGSPSSTLMRHGELMSSPGTTDKVPALDFCYASGIGVRDCNMEDPHPDSVGGSMYFYQGPERGNFVCMDCHSGYRYYYRTPQNITNPVDPKVTNAQASPVSVANDGAGPVLFTAFVVDPNENLSSVKINLSALGGSGTQTMYDDGTNGDETAGDDVYGFLLSGTTAGIGNYTITITAQDADTNTATGVALVVVHNESGAIIVDNLEAEFACAWTITTGIPTQLWGFNAHSRRGNGDGSCTATWSFDVPVTGDYNVYARWTSNIYRCTNVPYTIHYNGGTYTAWVNQQLNGGTWIQLGTGPFNFAAETSHSVVLSNDATGGPVESRRDYIIADAVKLVAAP